MEGCPRKPLLCAVAFLVGLAGVLSCLVGRAGPAGAQSSRVLQVWPDRSRGVASGRLEGAPVQAVNEVFPFGVCYTSAGDVVRAHTYLHFPHSVFPAGTDVVRATLYVYVDSSSGMGEATVGAYRVLEPWGEEGWGDEPATWPQLLVSPIAVTVARFSKVMPLPVSTPATSAIHNRPSAFQSSPLTTPTPPASPLTTPTEPARPTVPSGATSTPTPTVPPDATPTPTPPIAPPPTLLSTPTPSSLPGGLVVPLQRVAGTRLTWDVTALMRAWMAGEVPNDGLALAPAPEPNAGPDAAGDLLLARQLSADDANTRPYLIVEFGVRPVTPTPVLVLPTAGRRVGWGVGGLVLIGVAVLLVGLVLQHR